jgi:hypothetical protein
VTKEQIRLAVRQLHADLTIIAAANPEATLIDDYVWALINAAMTGRGDGEWPRPLLQPFVSKTGAREKKAADMLILVGQVDAAIDAEGGHVSYQTMA